jgi:hypothetical protein
MSDLRKTYVEGTKQVESDFSVEVIEYAIPPSTMSTLRKSSSLLKASMEKVSLASNTSLISSQDQAIAEKLQGMKNVLIRYGTPNVYTNGVAWFEVITNKRGEVTRLLPIITDSIRLLKGGEGAIQKIGTQEAYFNIFEPDEEKRKEKERVWNDIGSKPSQLDPTLIDGQYRTGYNPNLNQVILVKNVSIDNNNYGDSVIAEVTDQAILLSYIDQYFTKFFEKGTMKTVLIYDKSGKTSVTEKKMIKEEFEKKTSGVKNSFTALMVGGDLDYIVLDSEIDANAFSTYRRQLREDILAGMNIPYDLMFSDSSNKASSGEATKVFNQYSVLPIQELFTSVLVQISRTMKNEFAEDGDLTLSLTSFDEENTIEEMKGLSDAVRSGWMSPNDAREQSNYDLEPVLNGDALYVPASREPQGESDEEIIAKGI